MGEIMENQDFCFVVTIESGSTDHGSAYVFDSVWRCEKLASEYCKRCFKDWHYDIEKAYFNTSN
mgnify:CR=1 FL=1